MTEEKEEHYYPPWESKPEPDPGDWPDLEEYTDLKPGDLFAYEDALGIQKTFEISVICPETGGVGVNQIHSTALKDALSPAEQLEQLVSGGPSTYVETDLESIQTALDRDSAELVHPDEYDYDSYWDGRVVVYE